MDEFIVLVTREASMATVSNLINHKTKTDRTGDVFQAVGSNHQKRIGELRGRKIMPLSYHLLIASTALGGIFTLALGVSAVAFAAISLLVASAACVFWTLASLLGSLVIRSHALRNESDKAYHLAHENHLDTTNPKTSTNKKELEQKDFFTYLKNQDLYKLNLKNKMNELITLLNENGYDDVSLLEFNSIKEIEKKARNLTTLLKLRGKDDAKFNQDISLAITSILNGCKGLMENYKILKNLEPYKQEIQAQTIVKLEEENALLKREIAGLIHTLESTERGPEDPLNSSAFHEQNDQEGSGRSTRTNSKDSLIEEDGKSITFGNYSLQPEEDDNELDVLYRAAKSTPVFNLTKSVATQAKSPVIVPIDENHIAVIKKPLTASDFTSLLPDNH